VRGRQEQQLLEKWEALSLELFLPLTVKMIAEQTSARETHATIKGMSFSMTTLICSCSDLAMA